MPAANPKRMEQYTVEQWEAACASARGLAGSMWENPPYAGIKNPEGWRSSMCYMKALKMFPPTPAGRGATAAKALRRGEKGNPAGGRTRRSTRRRKSRRNFRKSK